MKALIHPDPRKGPAFQNFKYCREGGEISGGGRVGYADRGVSLTGPKTVPKGERENESIKPSFNGVKSIFSTYQRGG
jgi:hypothetical protein